MKATLKLIIITLLMLLTSAPSTSFEKQPIGRVVKIKGKVLRKLPNGKYQFLKSGINLYQGDSIVSKSKSYVKILMKDDTLFQLGPKSKFVFEKFQMKTKRERTATYNLIQGKLRSLFTIKAKKKTLTIKTPTASMGVRGTEIVSDVYKYKGKIQTDIALISGKLEITTLSNKKFFIDTGYMVQLQKGIQSEKSFTQKKLPTQIFQNLKKQNRGGEVFLIDARKSSGEIKTNDIKFSEIKVPEVSKLKAPTRDRSLKRENEPTQGKIIETTRNTKKEKRFSGSNDQTKQIQKMIRGSIQDSTAIRTRITRDKLRHSQLKPRSVRRPTRNTVIQSNKKTIKKLSTGEASTGQEESGL